MKRILFNTSQKFPMYFLKRNEDSIQTSDLNYLSDLYSSELKSFAQKRKDDFLSGRFIAHYALKKLIPGHTMDKIARSESGRPIFQNSLKGSIAHSDQYACAYITTETDISAVGIDVESLFDQDTYSKMNKVVFTNNELDRIKRSRDPLLISTIIFSAKESLYKCIHQRYKRFIDFKEVETIGTNQEERSFKLRIDKEIISGNFYVEGNSIFTVIEDQG